MKTYLFIIACFILTACKTHLKISQTKIHKSSKFNGSFSINKIKVDSFSTTGLPTKFKIDSVFYCSENTASDNNIDQVNIKSHQPSYTKTIKFLTPNKQYTWYTWKYNDRNLKSKIDKVHFIPLCWYYLTLDWSYGFLTSGRRSIYFYFDEKNKLTLLFKDYENNGPF